MLSSNRGTLHHFMLKSDRLSVGGVRKHAKDKRRNFEKAERRSSFIFLRFCTFPSYSKRGQEISKWERCRNRRGTVSHCATKDELEHWKQAVAN